MALPQFFELGPLFWSQIGGDLLVEIGERFVNPSSRVLADFFELSRCLLNDRRNLCHLFRGKIQLGFEPFSHPISRDFMMAAGEEVLPDA